MPTPRPIIATISRREVGDCDDIAAEGDEGRGDAEAEQGGADGETHGEHGAEGEMRMMTAAMRP